MLILQTHNYDRDSLVPYDYKYLHRNFLGSTHLPLLGYIRSTHISTALYPIAMNNIPYEQISASLDYITDTDEARARRIEVLNQIVNNYEHCDQNRLAINFIFTNSFERALTSLREKDFLDEVAPAVQSLYTKCMDQVRLREGINQDDCNAKAFLGRGKHSIYVVTNYQDINQESLFFLSLGLVPVLFPDLKEKFVEIELEFFKVLVNRSQVKRISNVKATDAFNSMLILSKYEEQIQEIRLNNVIEQIVNTNITRARNTVQETTRQAHSLLEQYSALQNKYYEATKLLTSLEEAREDTLAEVKLALHTEGVMHPEINNDCITFETVGVVQFYNTDEAELTIKNFSDRRVKQLFTDIFIDQKYKLRVMTKWVYPLGSYTNQFQRPGHVNTALLSRDNAMFNPHMEFYNCIGDYYSEMANAVGKQDLTMFVNLAIASNKSINFRDGTVMNRWKEWFQYQLAHEEDNYDSRTYLTIPCLVDEDGMTYSFSEVYGAGNNNTPVRDIDVEEL